MPKDWEIKWLAELDAKKAEEALVEANLAEWDRKQQEIYNSPEEVEKRRTKAERETLEREARDKAWIIREEREAMEELINAPRGIFGYNDKVKIVYPLSQGSEQYLGQIGCVRQADAHYRGRCDGIHSSPTGCVYLTFGEGAEYRTIEHFEERELELISRGGYALSPEQRRCHQCRHPDCKGICACANINREPQ